MFTQGDKCTKVGFTVQKTPTIERQELAVDQVKAMKVFVRIYERSSFTLAAEDLHLPRATLTHTLNQFEAWLGTRLLERSTRKVQPTLDGEAYYQHIYASTANPKASPT
jgi:hypothetical protein